MSDEVMLWRKRRTLRWQSLSLAARGAAEGIAVALDARGELHLGKIGLRGLAGLLGRPWTEVEPAVSELFETDTYRYDEEHRVVSDPQHPERQSVRPPRPTDHPPSDPDHSKSDPHEWDIRQLQLFGSSTDHPPDRREREISDLRESSDDPSSSSDQMIQEREKKTDHPGTLVPSDADEPPPWGSRIYEQVHAARLKSNLPPLPPFMFVWPKFVEWIVEAKKSYASRSGLQKRYREFLVFEKPLPTPDAAPISEARPIDRQPKAVPTAEDTARAARQRDREEADIGLIPHEDRIAIARAAMAALEGPRTTTDKTPEIPPPRPLPAREANDLDRGEPLPFAEAANGPEGILAALCPRPLPEQRSMSA